MTSTPQLQKTLRPSSSRKQDTNFRKQDTEFRQITSTRNHNEIRRNKTIQDTVCFKPAVKHFTTT